MKKQLSEYRINPDGILVWSATSIVWEVTGLRASSGQPTFVIRRLITKK